MYNNYSWKQDILKCVICAWLAKLCSVVDSGNCTADGNVNNSSNIPHITYIEP